MKNKDRVLIIDDDPNITDLFVNILEEEYAVDVAHTAEAGLAKVRAAFYPVVILDYMLPGGKNGLEALKELKALDDTVTPVMITASRDVDIAVQTMKAGAYDYFTKPFNVQKVRQTVANILKEKRLEQEVGYLREEVNEMVGYGEIIGKSAVMQKVYELIRQMEQNDAPVLIEGRSGTGKELVARAIHYNGLRKNNPFIAVNCAAIPVNLLESELFGYEKGAFTGAVALKHDKVELAHQGTLFLDEVSSLPVDMQAKLLRVLQESEVERLGGTKTIRLDLRIIAASNKDLKKAVADGSFREDLFYRLNVVPIQLAPLAERIEDILIIADHYIRFYNRKYHKQVTKFSKKAQEMLQRYAWPGNVRELKNLVERLVVLSRSTEITEHVLPMEIVMSINTPATVTEAGEMKAVESSLKDATSEFEKRMLVELLQKFHGNQTKVAEVLGVHRNTIVKKKKKYNLYVKARF